MQDQQLVRAALDELKRRPKVTFVEHGQALLDTIGSARPRLVVLDLQMPVLGGLETLQRIRQAPRLRDIPVVVFTSSSHPQDIQRCQRLGVADYVTKPMDFGTFCSAVERVLAHVRAPRLAA